MNSLKSNSLQRLQSYFDKEKWLKQLYSAYNGCMMSLLSRHPIGTNVYERDWDVLVILDTCRVDALREVAPEYDFIDTVDSILSVGSASSEWMAQTFHQKYLQEVRQTAYVSGNAWSEWVIEDRQMPEEHFNSILSWTKWDVAGADDFLILDQAWKYKEEDPSNPEPGHLHPRYVTDRAIEIARSHNPGRLVIHYSQPHAPYTAIALEEQRDLLRHEERPFDHLKDGGSPVRVWNSYLDHLRLGLDHVDTLINNIDADTVVLSADHGEAFGEWFIYGHPPSVLHPKIRHVPWAVTSAEDSGEYEPEIDPTQREGQTATEQLEALGYL